MDNVTFIVLKVVIAVACTIITYYLIPALKKYAQNKDNEQLISMIELSVRAAEQTFGHGQGAAKKEDVIEFISNWLEERNIKVTEDQISQLIEAAVYSMKRDAQVNSNTYTIRC